MSGADSCREQPFRPAIRISLVKRPARISLAKSPSIGITVRYNRAHRPPALSAVAEFQGPEGIRLQGCLRGLAASESRRP